MVGRAPERRAQARSQGDATQKEPGPPNWAQRRPWAAVSGELSPGQR